MRAPDVKSAKVIRLNFKGVDRRPRVMGNLISQQSVVPIYEGLCLTPKEWLARDIEPRDRLLGDLLTTTSRVLFSADTGAGKTLIAIACAFAMHLGRDFLHWRSHRRARVLYIDGELPRDLLQEYIALACTWFGIDPPSDGPMFICREDFEDLPPLDTTEGQEWLDAKIELLRPDFIIFDNLMSLCSAVMRDEEGWHDLKPYVLSLTRRRIGQLWIHHTGHKNDHSYGTKAREWMMDTVFIGNKVGTDHLVIDLDFESQGAKTRRRMPSNAGDFKSLRVELIDGGWRSGDAPSPKERLNRSEETALQALRHATANGDATEDEWREFAFNLGISSSEGEARRRAFTRARNSLLKKGKVKRVEEGKWRVIA